MRTFWWVTLLTLTAACAAVTEPASPGAAGDRGAAPETALPNLGPAPELTPLVWLNVDRPLRLAGLRGRVVLLDMWTFG